MEVGVTGEEQESSKTPRTYTDIFYEVFPHYLAMGMPSSEFWEGSSNLVIGYRNAFRIRMDNEEAHWAKINDRAAWLNGVYIRHAFQSMALLVNGFVPKGVQMQDYPDKPFYEKEEERINEEKRRKAEEEQQKIAMAMFQAAITKFNKRFEGKTEQN